MIGALFGGTFDPPHIGHQMIVDEVLKSLHVEVVFVVPAYLNPFKSKFYAPADVRLGWLHKLFGDNDRVEIADFEVKQKRAVASIETVKYLLEKYDLEKLYLIIGADNYAKLHMWSGYDELKNLVEFVIASRDGIITPKGLKKIKINANISSSKLRADLDMSFVPNVIRDEISEFYKTEKN